MKRRDSLFSALAPLRPISVMDVATGEVLTLSDHDDAVGTLLSYVRNETHRLYQEEGDYLGKAIVKADNKIGSANSFIRQHGLG